MTNSDTTTAPRKGAFIPKGSPEQQASNVAGIAKAYGTEGNALRRKADRLDRHAAKLEAASAAGTPITLLQVCEALMSGNFQAQYRARRLAGIEFDGRDVRELVWMLRWPKRPYSESKAAPAVANAHVVSVEALEAATEIVRRLRDAGDK